MEQAPEQQYFDVNQQDSLRKFSKIFYEMINRKADNYEQIVILCIGTDRCTGDSFGPLVGYKLSSVTNENIILYGTLDNPVHAKNLEEIIENIYETYSKPLVVAIDACLGRNEHIGYITIVEGPIKPGIGVNKELPEIGDISITGIVNFSGFMEFVVLQNTRLSLVMRMADLTADGIRNAMWRHNIKGKKALFV
ncbi:MAG: spore protease YyaC [Ignavibacteriales bacterium]